MSTAGPSSTNDTEHAINYANMVLAIIAVALVVFGIYRAATKDSRPGITPRAQQATWHLTIHDMDGTVLQKGIQAKYSESPVPMLAFYESATGNNWLDNVQPTTGFDTGEGVRDGWIAKWCSDLSGGGVFITEDGSSVRWAYVWRDKKLGGGGILRKWKLVRR